MRNSSWIALLIGGLSTGLLFAVVRQAVDIPAFKPADGQILAVPFVDLAGLCSPESPNQQEVLYYCRTATPPESMLPSSASILASFVGGERNILFEGPPGTGKSTLAWAAALHLVASGISVLWVHPELVGATCVSLQPAAPGSAWIAVNHTDDVKQFLIERPAQRLFVDTARNTSLIAQNLIAKVAAWYRIDPAHRKVYLISSMRYQFKRLAAAPSSVPLMRAVRVNHVQWAWQIACAGRSVLSLSYLSPRMGARGVSRLRRCRWTGILCACLCPV